MFDTRLRIAPQRFLSLALVPLAAMLVMASTGHAKNDDKDKGHGKSDKHAKHEDKGHKGHKGHKVSKGDKADHVAIAPGSYFNDQHRNYAQLYYGERYGKDKGCPQGLAKKNNGCMPPGQAKKWRIGQPVPQGYALYPVPQPVLVQLPPVPYGYRYGRLGGDIVLVLQKNNLIIDIMLAL